MIELSNLTVKFGGNTAVDDVSLTVDPNQFVSIIGPNGAGKTTLFNLITGQYRPTGGSIHLNGQDITPLSVAQRAQLGIGRSFQLAAYYPDLTVLDNVALAVQRVQKKSWVFWKPQHHFKEIREQAYEMLKQVFLEKKWDKEAKTLSHGEQRKLEIGILLGMAAEILVLDEPTAGMSIEEVPLILDMIEALKDERKRTILLVEHKLDMIMRLSDAIVVMHEGRLIAYDEPEAIVSNQQVQAAYLGKSYEH